MKQEWQRMVMRDYYKKENETFKKAVMLQELIEKIVEDMCFGDQSYIRCYRQGIEDALGNPSLLEAIGYVKKEKVEAYSEMVKKTYPSHIPQQPVDSNEVLDELESWVKKRIRFPHVTVVQGKYLLEKISELRQSLIK